MTCAASPAHHSIAESHREAENENKKQCNRGFAWASDPEPLNKPPTGAPFPWPLSGYEEKYLLQFTPWPTAGMVIRWRHRGQPQATWLTIACGMGLPLYRRALTRASEALSSPHKNSSRQHNRKQYIPNYRQARWRMFNSGVFGPV